MNLPQLSIFLSYSHQDKGIARTLAKELRKAGLRVWIDEGELRAGDSIIGRIADAISDVEFVVALISKNSISSKWCTKELLLAVNDGLDEGRVRVLPLRVDDAEMPASLRDVFYLQVSSKSLNRVLNRLIKDVQSHHEDLLTRPFDRFRYKLVPPSPHSSIDVKTANRLKAALISPRIERATLGNKTWKAVNNAQAVLMRDYSVPSMDILFECAVKDNRRSWVAGYATSGLILLAPASTPWIQRLLNHRNRRVALETLKLLVEFDEILLNLPQISAFPLRDVSRQIFLEIKRRGNWLEFKKRLINHLQQENAILGKRFGPRSRKNNKYRGLLSKVRRMIIEVDSGAQ